MRASATTEHLTARRGLTVSMLLLLALVLPLLLSVTSAAHAATRQSGAAATSSSPAPAHPFSDPVWYPLRKPATVACVKGNPGCTDPNYHSYWAMDIDSMNSDVHAGDPIYAAGAGVYHVGQVDPGCAKTSKEAGAGTWVWVDHGGGVVSKYEHLAALNPDLHDGDYVTPTTEIGTVGNSGAIEPCNVAYLDFQTRTGGINGTPYYFGSLKACLQDQSTPVMFPNDISSWTNWNDVPHYQLYGGTGLYTPATTSDCITDATVTPSRPTGVTVASKNRAVTVSWAAPDATDQVDRSTVSFEIYHPSSHSFGSTQYVDVPAGATSTTFHGLVNGREYRARVVSHNSVGNSANSAWQDVVPAAAPKAITKTRWLTSTFHGINFAWARVNGNGAVVTHYVVAIRHFTHHGWTAYTPSRISPTLIHFDWRGLASHARYEVRVRALTDHGNTPWLARHVTTKG